MLLGFCLLLLHSVIYTIVYIITLTVYIITIYKYHTGFGYMWGQVGVSNFVRVPELKKKSVRNRRFRTKAGFEPHLGAVHSLKIVSQLRSIPFCTQCSKTFHLTPGPFCGSGAPHIWTPITFRDGID